MTDLYKPSKKTSKYAKISRQDYDRLYQESVSSPNKFWGEMAKRLDWFTPPTIIKNTNFNSPVSIKWYEDGILNACYNCVDRHLPEKLTSTALIFEGNNPEESYKVSYGELKDEVCKLANALKERGVKKGDRVTIYMPMVPEATYAMLACARIGAIHSVVFGGFSPESLKNRIIDCQSNIVITADGAYRGNKTIPLKHNVDEAVKGCMNVHTVLVLKRTGEDIDWNEERDIWWDEITNLQSSDCPCEPMNAEDPLFILYTSGSTGTPKGVLHTTGGYMVYVSLTHEYVFDYHAGEVYWCTADVGWITGHSYIVYGPLANGAISLIFEGVPNYPDASRLWQVVDKHQVNIFYTAPTALRSLLAAGDEMVTCTNRKSLRILGTVGEPINKEAWEWYYNIIGDKRCPVIDTWWQTETGGHMLTPLASFDLKPGSATKPFFGVQPVLLDKNGQILDGNAEGALAIKNSWPGQMRGVYNDPERFEQTYFSDFPGYFFTGDGARRDKDGDYWITGRTDDVLNVSGHRMGTAEIESAINEHKNVAESAVVGFPHEIKGQEIFAYVTLMEGANVNEDEIRAEIIQNVRKIIGPIAAPQSILFAHFLPKTRSGKIMRRILRKIAANEFEDLGDISTLADSSVVEDLIRARKSV
ncbi:MAG: acetate--CoA ligase [Alphaproteobacteria bacterium]|nr:MAG: acetate--CoA ligase [Alphaproteobacteria bacterium]